MDLPYVVFLLVCCCWFKWSGLTIKMSDNYEIFEDGRDNLDRLTDLPINVKHQIQENMDIEDAARMSILSSKWRYVWASNPKLIIPTQFCRKRKQSGKKRKQSGKKRKQSGTLDIVNRILLQHCGSIKTFLLDISVIQLSEHSVVDQWILYLSKNGLKALTLLNLENKSAPYKLPSDVFGVELELLNLSNCILRPPCSFGGFHKLKSLQLIQVAFELDIATSLLCIPNLEYLMFDKCSGLHHLNIYAPELLKFKFKGCGIDTIKLSPFMNCRKLRLFAVTSQKVSPNRQQEPINLIKFLSSWPEIRILLLGRNFLEILASGNVEGRLSMRLNQLVILAFHIFDFNDEDHLCTLLCILRSSPNLGLLRFALDRSKKGSREVDENYFERKDCSRIDELSKLHVLTINKFQGSRVELLFVRLVLASAPSLLKLIIEVDKEVSENQAIKISEELMQFRRATLKLQVICSPQKS